MTTASTLSPTSAWLASAPYLPAVTGPADTAQRLLLLAHYGIDWSNGWVGRYRATYWDKVLPDRVIVATYRAATLDRWWSEIAVELGTSPRNAAERAELAQLLRQPDSPVLHLFREETEALLLRVRIVADEVRASKALSVPA